MENEKLTTEGSGEDSQKGMFMIFQTDTESFGISIEYVNEIIAMQPITPLPDVEHFIKGLINLRGKIIPVVDVRARFGMEPVEYTDRTCIIVIDVKNMMVGLIVEKIEETITIDEESVISPPSLDRMKSDENKYVYGLARTVDHGVKLLLDPRKLISDEALELAESSQTDKEE